MATSLASFSTPGNRKAAAVQLGSRAEWLRDRADRAPRRRARAKSSPPPPQKEREALVRSNPFVREAQKDPSKLAVVFLKNAPSARAVRSLQSSIRGPELVRAQGKQAYIVYPNGMGRSRLTAPAIEKAGSEWRHPTSTPVSLTFNITIFLAIVVSTVLYLITLSRKPKPEVASQ